MKKFLINILGYLIGFVIVIAIAVPIKMLYDYKTDYLGRVIEKWTWPIFPEYTKRVIDRKGNIINIKIKRDVEYYITYLKNGSSKRRHKEVSKKEHTNCFPGDYLYKSKPHCRGEKSD